MLKGLRDRLRSLVRPSLGLATVAVLALAGTASAGVLAGDHAEDRSGPQAFTSAASVPTVAGYWKLRYRVPGSPLKATYSFLPCDGCAAIALVRDPLRASSQRVRMKRRGGVFVAVYRSNSYCGYRQVIKFRPGRSVMLEGQRLAVRGTGTFFSRQKGCAAGTGRRGSLRFKARRISLLRVVGANVSADALGDGCNTLPYRFEGDADSFPDFFSRNSHSFSWDFGDGDTSTERRPRHTFPRPGRYFVTVTIRLTDGSVARGTDPVDVSEPAENC